MRTRSAAWRVLTQSGLLVTRHPTSSAAKEEAGSAEMSNKRRVKEHKSGQKTQNIYKQQRIWRTTRVWFLCRPVLRWCPRLGMVGPTDGVHRASIDRRRHSYHSHQPTSHWLILISFLLSRIIPHRHLHLPRRSIMEFRNWGFSQRPGLRVQSKVHLRCNNLKAATSMNTEYRIRNRGGIQRTQL